MKFRLFLACALLASVSTLTVAGPPPTLLYSYNNQSDLVTVDPATGVASASLGAHTEESAQALAMDPASGVMYVGYIKADPSFAWALGTVNLADGQITEIAEVGDYSIRGLVFDKTGKLWGVTGNNGTAAHALISINKTTGAVTEENTSLPTIRHKIAYSPAFDALLLLSYDSMGSTWNLNILPPAVPTTLIPVPLSGASLDGVAQLPAGMVFDNVNTLLITIHEATGDSTLDVVTIDPQTGIATALANSGVSGNSLAFDQGGTVPVELSEFAVE